MYSGDLSNFSDNTYIQQTQEAATSMVKEFSIESVSH